MHKLFFSQRSLIVIGFAAAVLIFFGDNVFGATRNVTSLADGPSIYGSGIINEGTATLNNCTFFGNGAGGKGGGLWNASGFATVSSSTFMGNTAADGGGIRSERLAFAGGI